MNIGSDDFFQLTYCTNIHPAEGWPAVEAKLREIAPALRATIAPNAKFGLGLRLSAREARELLIGDTLARFRSFLDHERLYVALINGFPYGPFHGTVVKEGVYAPDWRTPERLAYTLDLIEILKVLLPEGLDGGVSTAPLSYKAWMTDGDEGAWGAITDHVMQVVEVLVRVRRDDGVLIHLDIEPEPDCVLENGDETIEFFERRLLTVGARVLAARLGVSESDAREHILAHVQVCFDCSHFAVEFEDPRTALDRFERAGIRVGRVQLSSALRVIIPADAAGAAAVAARLEPFAESTYLHQVVEVRNGAMHRFPDLPQAISVMGSDRGQTGVRPGSDQGQTPTGREWRIHFHVPLFTREYDGLGSTQDYVRSVIELAREKRFTRHLEIETYTWDVLPAHLKLDISDSIAREYRWVLDAFEGRS